MIVCKGSHGFFDNGLPVGFNIMRSPAQKSECKDLKRNGQDRAITLKPLTLRLLTAPARAQGVFKCKEQN
ncbi:hypothetical protein NCCP2648_15670 [Lacticaseibacillus rhamnosus]|nr:hypothetical protein NCCP2648_15670 [Lacticaseibacillus rhamnosus]